MKPSDADGDDAAGMDSESLERQVAALEAENRGLRELAEGQARQLEELARRVAALEGRKQVRDAEAVDAGDDQGQDWWTPRRRPGMPDAGGGDPGGAARRGPRLRPGAPLVAEWRQMRVGSDQVFSRVDRARAAVRWWELEVEMLG